MSKIQYSAGFESNNFVVEYSQLVQEGHSGAYITQLPLTGIDATRQLEVWLGSLCKESKVTTDSRVARAQETRNSANSFELASSKASRIGDISVVTSELISISCRSSGRLSQLHKLRTSFSRCCWRFSAHSSTRVDGGIQNPLPAAVDCS